MFWGFQEAHKQAWSMDKELKTMSMSMTTNPWGVLTAVKDSMLFFLNKNSITQL